jgi:hypothetical protein
MNRPLFEEKDFPLESKVLRFIAENFTGEREMTVRRKELEKTIGENLTPQKVGFLTQALKKFGIKTTSKVISSRDDNEKLTFVTTEPDLKKLSEVWQAIQRKKTATPIIIA